MFIESPSNKNTNTNTTVCVLRKCLHNKPRVVFDNESLITQLICKHNGMYSLKTSVLFYTTRSILSLCFGFKACYANEDQLGVFPLLLNYGTDKVDPVSTLYSLHAAWPAILTTAYCLNHLSVSCYWPPNVKKPHDSVRDMNECYRMMPNIR